ncbi:MAG: helix-turn-helix domain-containing protein [Burkholderiales bacterium]
MRYQTPALSEWSAGPGLVRASPERTGLSQSQFATLLGVSVRTLQAWQQGRKPPSGAARTSLTIALTNPRALLAVAGEPR